MSKDVFLHCNCNPKPLKIQPEKRAVIFRFVSRSGSTRETKPDHSYSPPSLPIAPLVFRWASRIRARSRHLKLASGSFQQKSGYQNTPTKYAP